MTFLLGLFILEGMMWQEMANWMADEFLQL